MDNGAAPDASQSGDRNQLVIGSISPATSGYNIHLGREKNYDNTETFSMVMRIAKPMVVM